MLMPDSVRDSLSDLVPQFMNYINAGQLIPSVKEIRMRMALHRFLDRESWCRIQKITYYCLPIWTVSTQLFICFTAPYARFLCHKDKTNAYGGKSSVSCPLKPSDSAPLKHSTMPP